MRVYNTEKRTEFYIKQLDKWARKIKEYRRDKEINDEGNDEEQLHKVRTFPINKKGDILLIINSKNTFATHSFGQRCVERRGELEGKICQVLGLFDNTTASYHPPDGDYDLEVKLDGEIFLRYVDEHIIAYADSSLPAYVFLPNKKLFKKFKRFLPLFTERSNKLKKILKRYYSQLKN